MSDFENEEEDFGDDDEEVIIDDNDDDEIELDETFAITEQPKKAKEPEEDTTMVELQARFNPKTGAARRLLTDLREIMKQKPEELGFRCFPKGNDIFNWEVQVFGFDKGTPMLSDLEKYKKQTGRDYVEMQVTFSPEYPIHPPFVRVIQPRFQFHTGRVTVGGSLCTDILTQESWNPMYDITGLMVNIFSEIMNGNPRIDFQNSSPYSLEEAKQAYLRVASDHKWKPSQFLPNK